MQMLADEIEDNRFPFDIFWSPPLDGAGAPSTGDPKSPERRRYFTRSVREGRQHDVTVHRHGEFNREPFPPSPGLPTEGREPEEHCYLRGMASRGLWARSCRRRRLFRKVGAGRLFGVSIRGGASYPLPPSPPDRPASGAAYYGGAQEGSPGQGPCVAVVSPRHFGGPSMTRETTRRRFIAVGAAATGALGAGGERARRRPGPGDRARRT
jgi:hypothetical protein